ncbi:arabinosyltransferase domain-containing protein [Nocardia sp. IFM 10818]
MATPLLPVRQQQASLDWPQPQAVQLTAPLVDYVPLSLDVTIPCTVFRDAPGGTVLSTIPAQAPGAAEKGLLVRVEDEPDTGRTLSVLLRNNPLLTASLTEIIGAGTTPEGEPTAPDGSGVGAGPTAAPATTAPGAAAPGAIPPGVTPTPGSTPPPGTTPPPGSTPPPGITRPGGIGQPGATPPSGETSPPPGDSALSPGAAPGVDPNVVAAPRCAALVVQSTSTATTAELTGLTRADGSAFHTVVESDIRPQIVGVYTDLERARLGDARLHAEIDARFSSSPSPLKLAAIAGAVLFTLIALIALHLLDTTDGRSARRFLPARWWRLTPLDGVVAGALALWHVIGANTSDDGYILTMARASREAGYTANYYRWFGVAEAPFGWPYEVLAQLTRFTETGLWLRLPALLTGLLCWWVISREVLPRLGSRVRSSTVARWTAGLAFLSIWLPYNNGLRPEPLIALGALLTWCSMERAIATRRLLPASIAVLIAAFSLAAGPSGLICVAALIAGSRTVLRTIIVRARTGAAGLGQGRNMPSVASAAYRSGSKPIRSSGDGNSARDELSGAGTGGSGDANGGNSGRGGAGTGGGARAANAREDRTRAGRLTGAPGHAGDGSSGDELASANTGIHAEIGGVGVDNARGGRGAGSPARAGGRVSRAGDAVGRGGSGSGWRKALAYSALVAPGLAAGLVVLVVVFADQTLATVLEATRVRKAVGPDLGWSDELTRWESLLSLTPDGSVARRFGVLVMLLCLGTCVLVALRKGGRIPDTARGPVARVLGVVFMALVLMMFTPTKWTHHLGVYAGLAAAVAAVTAVAMGSNGVRARHYRTLFAAAVFFLLAVAFTGSSGWWYVSGYGVAWPDRAPAVGGVAVATVFLGLTVVCLLVAVWRYYREPRFTAGDADSKVSDRFAIRPLTAALAALVLFEVGTMAVAAYRQYPAYSVALSNLRALGGDSCAMADDVLVERNTGDSLLQPYTGSVADGLAAQNTGFTANGVGSLIPDAGGPGGDQQGPPPGDGSGAPGGPGGSGAPSGAGAPGGSSAPGGAGGPGGDPRAGQPGINGSTVALPFGLDPVRTPVLGSYATGEAKPAELTSQWYRIDLAAALRDSAYRVLVLTAAGHIASVDDNGRELPGQRLRVEFAHRAEDGTVRALGELTPPTIGGAPMWRNMPIELGRIPEGANAIRLVARVDDPTGRQWIAVTPPRLPKLATLGSVVGTDPVLADFQVGFAFPCQRPFDTEDGVAELPVWRILPDKLNARVAETWQGDTGGGPLGWTNVLMRSRTVPSYLEHDWTRDWGELQLLNRFLSVPTATIGTRVETRWGWADEAPITTG